MNKYGKRERIISYVAPHVALFPTTYGLVFGTRHGMSVFTDDILALHGDGDFKNLIISGGITQDGTVSEARTMFQELICTGHS